MSNGDNVNEEKGLVEFRRKVRSARSALRTHRTAAAVPAVLPDACAWLCKTDAFCGKRYRQRAFLPEPPWLPWGPGCRAGQGRQSKKQRHRSETKPDKDMLAHTPMRGLKLPVSPIVTGVDEDAESGNLAVPASGETKPESGADSGTGGDGKHSAGSLLRGEQGANAETSGGSIVE